MESYIFPSKYEKQLLRKKSLKNSYPKSCYTLRREDITSNPSSHSLRDVNGVVTRFESFIRPDYREMYVPPGTNRDRRGLRDDWIRDPSKPASN